MTTIYQPSGTSLDSKLSAIDVATITVSTLNINGTVNGQTVTGQLVFTEGDQTINGQKTFTDIVITTLNIDNINSVTTDAGVNIAGVNIVEKNVAVMAQNFAIIRPTSTDVFVAITPTGAGALMTTVADNTATGGNGRGQNAIDLQMIRSLNTQVASGFRSVICGGSGNEASGDYACVAGGSGNRAAANVSFVYGTQMISTGVGGDFVAGTSCQSSGGNCVILGCDQSSSNQARSVMLGCTNTHNDTARCVAIGVTSTASVKGCVIYCSATTSDANSTIISSNNSNINTTTAPVVIIGGSGNNGSGANCGIFSSINSTVGTSCSVVLGGTTNTGNGQYTAVLGGNSNNNTGNRSVIGGGNGNTCTGNDCALLGGRSGNIAADSSFVFGAASVTHLGGFIITDSDTNILSSVDLNQFAARFANGYRIIGGPLLLTGGSVTETHYGNIVSSTDNTPQTMYQILTTTDTTNLVTVEVTARDFSGNSGVWKFSVRVKNTAGTLTIGTPFLSASDIDAAINTATVTTGASGNFFNVIVTGIALTVIYWGGTVTITKR